MSPPRSATATNVLVISSWFPAVDESSRGRFVADQVQALAAGERVRPTVVSFDAIGLAGSPATQASEAAAISELTRSALGRGRGPFNDGAVNAPPGVPVARIALAAGSGGPPSAVPAERREAVLSDLVPILAGVEIVHAHTGFPDGAASASLARQLGAPLVITEHASFVSTILAEPERRIAYLNGVRAARRVIAVSGMLGRELADAIPEIGDKLSVIPNAVDVDAFTARPLAERRMDELVYIGYRVESKGLSLLLRSFSEVRRQRPGATLRLIGRSVDAETEKHWHDLARDLGILDAVAFEPPALRPAVADALGRASILVHASPRETFGMTAAEALASGTPVVAIASGGVTETVGTDGRFGEIVVDQDPRALAAAVVRTLERRATFDAQVLRDAVVARYGSTTVADQLADLYDGLLGLDGPRGGSTDRMSTSAEPGVPAGEEAERSVLVVGFLTNRAERLLRTLPPQALARIDLLCSTGPHVASLPVGLRSVRHVDIDGPYRLALGPDADLPRASSIGARVARLARDPIGVIRRRRVRGRREDYRASAAKAALDDMIATHDGAGWTDVVGVSGIDYVAIRQVPAAARRIGPGGLRWLADSLGSGGKL